MCSRQETLSSRLSDEQCFLSPGWWRREKRQIIRRAARLWILNSLRTSALSESRKSQQKCLKDCGKTAAREGRVFVSCFYSLSPHSLSLPPLPFRNVISHIWTIKTHIKPKLTSNTLLMPGRWCRCWTIHQTALPRWGGDGKERLPLPVLATITILI